MNFGREWKDLKKFEKLSDIERSIVFYAENKASMNHFKTLIDELTQKMNLKICYVTSVSDDPIFKSQNKNIFSFYVGSGIIRTKFFLTLNAKILLMDMPDLNNFHIKKSKTCSVHYIYIFHSMFSVHSYLRKNAIDHFDTIFCVGPHHINEILESEKIYNLKQKNLVKYGFGRLDSLLQQKQNYSEIDNELIIISPSYGDNNLLEICGIELIEILLKSNFEVLLRPHMKILKDSEKLIQKIKNLFEDNPNFFLETGIIPFEKLNNSSCMISDWSGISLEYAFVFKRPVIFIDVPKKILNPDYDDISFKPIETSIRNKIGHVVDPKNIPQIPSIIENFSADKQELTDTINTISSEIVYNIGNSAEIGVKHIQNILNNLNSNT